MAGNMLFNLALMLGGTAAALIILRAAMITFLPDRLCGPEGVLIATSPRRDAAEPRDLVGPHGMAGAGTD